MTYNEMAKCILISFKLPDNRSEFLVFLYILSYRLARTRVAFIACRSRDMNVGFSKHRRHNTDYRSTDPHYFFEFLEQ